MALSPSDASSLIDKEVAWENSLFPSAPSACPGSIAIFQDGETIDCRGWRRRAVQKEEQEGQVREVQETGCCRRNRDKWRQCSGFRGRAQSREEGEERSKGSKEGEEFRVCSCDRGRGCGKGSQESRAQSREEGGQGSSKCCHDSAHLGRNISSRLASRVLRYEPRTHRRRRIPRG